MGAYPKDYTRDEFKHFLNENEFSELIIQKFETLPETVKYNGKDFTLKINVVFFSIGDGFHNFWMNYVCDNELLFEKKVFTNAEESIDYLITGVGNLK
jgi:hypothetical protein